MPNPTPRFSFVLTLAVAAMAAPPILAQCSNPWLGSPSVPPTNDQVTVATTWDPDGAGPLPPNLVIGGAFTVVGAVGALRIAAIDPLSGAVSALGAGVAALPKALAVLPNGDLVAGLDYSTGGTTSAPCVVRWTGTNWVPLGSGFSGFLPPAVHALAVLPNGDLVAGGQFTSAGGVLASRIARWNGTSWSALGAGMNNEVRSLLAQPDGTLVAGGAFTTAGGTSASCVALWNGSTWSAIGGGIYGGIGAVPAMVTNLTLTATGELVAGGLFTMGFVGTRGVVRWNGFDWSVLGSGVFAASALAALPDGDVLVGGAFATAGGVAANNIARWNGSSWAAVGSGTNGSVQAFAVLPNGDLVVGGSFPSAGGAAGTNVARITTTCPAVVATLGANCAGSGGPNVLVADSLPWAGSTFVATASGLSTSSLALSVLGFGTVALPLPTLLPQGGAGCSLWVSPDVLGLHLPDAGRVALELAIPDDLALVGRQLHEQVVAIELDALGALVAATSTNALTATIGAF